MELSLQQLRELESGKHSLTGNIIDNPIPKKKTQETNQP